MVENLYYAIYDISSNNMRNKAIIALKNAGMTRIQKSAFAGTLNRQKFKDLSENLKEAVGPEDRMYLIQSCERCFGKVTTIGLSFDKEYVSGKKEVEFI